MSWSAINALGSTYAINPNDNPAMADVPQGIGSVDITAYPATNPAPTVLTIQVSIGWEDAAGNGRTNGLVTLVAEQGLNP
jgi:hypothetical protein